jgi:hypothetical protein
MYPTCLLIVKAIPMDQATTRRRSLANALAIRFLKKHPVASGVSGLLAS